MKKLSISLITLAFAATAAQAQDSGAASPDQQAVPPAASDQPAQDVPSAPQDAVPPAPDAGAPPDASAPADAAAPPAAAPEASTATSASVTDTEVQSFAEASVKVQEIAKNTALDDTAKQQQMASAVTAAGLEPARFNEISKAVATDTELRARIQTAMAAKSSAHDG